MALLSASGSAPTASRAAKSRRLERLLDDWLDALRAAVRKLTRKPDSLPSHCFLERRNFGHVPKKKTANSREAVERCSIGYCRIGVGDVRTGDYDDCGHRA
jgi:hypothetical protein